ncbi:chemotaxis protein CheY [Microbacterium sp. CFBP9034]|uniref:chemotaxis protein CheY n=1 Tax=Microbacterium sp. CFBP9034 TaxID=3096540 RepID=UPI002A69D2A6|nr:chemotaxis protein CheY [Microbacterium sp. CFBP9034]MDY0910467.1 chemotaxis protein CheY [Microbacterium sp. CFBP9034]
MRDDIIALQAVERAGSLEFELTTVPPTRVRLRWSVVADGVARRVVAWELLLGMLAPGAELSNPCPRCGRPHGPVRTTDAAARPAVAYAGGIAVAAVADAGPGTFAIDAELETDPVRDVAGLDGVLGARMNVHLRDWVRAEAALKADGRGLRVDPGVVAVDAVTRTEWRAVVPGGAPVAGWDLDRVPGVVVSAAISGAEAGAPGDPAKP